MYKRDTGRSSFLIWCAPLGLVHARALSIAFAALSSAGGK
jgi:hypothetical protein